MLPKEPSGDQPEPLTAKVGHKLEAGLEQVTAGVKDLASKAGVGSGDTASSTRAKPKHRARATTGRTKDELYADAVRLGVKGRSRMTKEELEKAVRRG